MDFSVVGNKRKKAKKEKQYVSIEIAAVRPGGNKYTEVNFDEFKRDHLDAVGESSGEDERFHDRDALEIVRRLEAKYNKKGKKKNFQFNQDDFIDKSRGYDLEDAFIDDSEAFEEVLPSTMDTAKGGFYVNRGTLELRQVGSDEDMDVEDAEKMKSKKKNKEKQTTEILSSDDETGKSKKTGNLEEVSAIPRTTGPVPKRGLSQNEQSIDAKRRRLVGMPPTLRRSEKSLEIKEKQSTIKENEQSSSSNTKQKRASPPPPPLPKLSNVSSIASTSSKDDEVIIVLDETEDQNKQEKQEGLQNGKSMNEGVVNSSKINEKAEKANDFVKNMQTVLSVISEDRKKSMNLSQTDAKLKTLMENFRKELESFQSSGKKQLTNSLVDHLVKIDDFFEENKRINERNALIENLSKIIKISTSTIKLRINQRRTMIACANEKQQKEDDAQKVPAKKTLTATGLISSLQGTRLARNEEIPHLSAANVSILNNFLINFRKEVIITDSTLNEYLKVVSVNKIEFSNCIDTLKKIRDNCPKISKSTATPSGSVPSLTGQNSGSTNAGELKQRKSRVYLNVWVEESAEYFKLMLKSQNTFRNRDKELLILQARAIEVTKECLNKSVENHRQSKELAQIQGTPVANFSFPYSDYFIVNLNNYLDAVYELSVKSKKLLLLYTSLSAIHHHIEKEVSKGMFLIEVCRRLPKYAVVLGDEVAKKVLAEAKLSTEKFQVVQNSKYMLKWPDTVNPKSVSSNSNNQSLTKNGNSNSSSTCSQPQSSASSISKPSTSSAPPTTTKSDDDVQVLSSKISTPTKNAGGNNKNKLDELTAKILLAQMNQTIPIQQKQAILMQYRMTYGDALFQLALLQVQISLNAVNEEKKKKTEENERKKKEEAEKLKMEMEKKRKEELERIRLENERKAEERRKLAEEKKRKAEMERIEKERLKAVQREEERLKKEREAREMKERREREEEERRREQERLQRELEKIRKQKEMEEAERKERERQMRLAQEAADALQNLEQDNLLDDMDFVSEQEKKQEEEKKNAEIVRKKQWNEHMEKMRAKQQAVEEQRVKDIKPNIKDTVVIKSEPVSQEIEEADRYMERVMNEAEAASKKHSNQMSSYQTDFRSSNKAQPQNQFPKSHNPVTSSFNNQAFSQHVRSPVSSAQIRSPMTQQFPQSPQFMSQNPVMTSPQSCGYQPIAQSSHSMTSESHQRNPHFNQYGQIQPNTSVMPQNMGFGGLMNQTNQQVMMNQMQQNQWNMLRQQQQQQQQHTSQQQMFMNQGNFDYR